MLETGPLAVLMRERNLSNGGKINVSVLVFSSILVVLANGKDLL